MEERRCLVEDTTTEGELEKTGKSDSLMESTNKDDSQNVEYYKSQLESCQKRLLRVERQLEKSEHYNEDLRSQLEKVSAELHQYRTASKQRVDAAVQTEERNFTADPDKLTVQSVQQNTDAEIYQKESVDTLLKEKAEETGAGEQIYANKSNDEQLPSGEKQAIPKTTVVGDEVAAPSTSLAEELKSAAEEAISQSGYVYDERSGLYYDYNSGYYYDAEKSLFYDPNSGTYFYFNNETQEYTFHSQVDVSQYTTPYYGYYKNNTYRDYDQPSSTAWTSHSSSYSQGQGHYSSQRHSDRRDRRQDSKTSSRRKALEDKENKYYHHTEKYSTKRSRHRDKAKSEGFTEKPGNKRKSKSEKKKKKKKERDSEDKKSKKKKKKETKKERKKKRKEKKEGKDNDKVIREDMDTREQVCVIDSTGHIEYELTENSDVMGQSKKTEHMDSCDTDQRELENMEQTVMEEQFFTDVTLTKTDINVDVKQSEANTNNNNFSANVDTSSEGVLMGSKKCDNVTVTTDLEKDSTHENLKSSEERFFEINEQGNSGKLSIKENDSEKCKDKSDTNLSLAVDLTSNETQVPIKCPDLIDESSMSQDSVLLQEHKDSTDDSSRSSDSSTPSTCTSSRSVCTDESELESGELSESVGDNESVVMVSEDEDSDCAITGIEAGYADYTDQTQGYFEDMGQGEEIGSGSWPPCIRLIVTDSDCLDPGSLFIVTCDGAQIGRENDQGNAIIIPDLNVSKVHASISYQSDLQQYVIVDHGSQNGTFLNESRISESKIESKAEKLSHGSTLQFSCTRFLLHIHNGTETCDDCEPGQVQATMSKPAQKEAYTILSKEEKKKQLRQNLKHIKKKYGLQNAPYVDNMAAIKNPTYQDKAEERRRTKGSDNPYIPDEAPASVNRPIAETNVGHKLLKKMGWSEGESLGKDNEGIQQPIMASIRANQKAGLGSSLGGEQSLDNANQSSKFQRKIQAQERFLKVSTENKNDQDPSSKNNATSNWVKGETQTF